ncbi:DTW domain-containing protein [Agarivorans sp. TSD2052]|uniref:tRNA-uridine aminocarboxypropyltransferase n=1 Tax=Agarivorans sp. TSD2052 TaxID=2937286 RepID=UPI00200E98C3|nr:tRNA-uridine aminocarboxypropyltransferase [Agarivorans sp. TSD2052]UPW18450.1 DTW domain-containing protein [Agarivorans sp. TSD2052]
MSRPRCQRCLRPVSHCLCPHIPNCEHRHSVLILQHPSEQKNAKGTAYLASLALNKAQLVIGETPADFNEICQAVTANPQQYWLIFPSETSQAIEQQRPLTEANNRPACPLPITLIFLDGTWRKALKLWHLNPWLTQIAQFHFANAPAGQYRIRKTRIDQGLSTIEAIAYTLQQIEDFNPTPLRNVLETLVEQQIAAMPKQIKNRY